MRIPSLSDGIRTENGRSRRGSGEEVDQQLVDPVGRLELPHVTCPTMGVWSTGDFALTEEQMTGSEKFVDAPWRYERVEGPGHWMQLEAPDRVNELLVDFLA